MIFNLRDLLGHFGLLALFFQKKNNVQPTRVPTTRKIKAQRPAGTLARLSIAAEAAAEERGGGDGGDGGSRRGGPRGRADHGVIGNVYYNLDSVRSSYLQLVESEEFARG